MGAIAPPQAGNLFPQMLALQAQENRMRQQQQQQQGDETKDEPQPPSGFQHWAEQMQQQLNALQSNNNDNGNLGPPPQFFNASIVSPFGLGGSTDGNNNNGEANNPFQGMQAPPPEVIQQAIQQAMTGVIERLAQMNQNNNNNQDATTPGNRLPPHLAKAFAQVLSNENLRKGIAENLARAAPALVDPRCQGVMLSVYVPPGADHPNRGMMPGQQPRPSSNTQPSSPSQQQTPPPQKSAVSGWLNKILSSSSTSQGNRGTSSSKNEAVQEEDDEEEEETIDLDEEDEKVTIETDVSDVKDPESASAPKGRSRGSKKERRERASRVAVATAAMADSEKARKQEKQTPEQRAQRHLLRLQSLCRPVVLHTPSDPVRARSWDAWTSRERGSIMFRGNRRALNAELAHRKLRIQLDTGTQGLGSALRHMLSARDVSDEMEDVIKCAVEIEAGRSQRRK
eukprot:scaffold73079_cov49-Attheya_sp.AAC.1